MVSVLLRGLQFRKNMASKITASAIQFSGSISNTTCAVGPLYIFLSWSFQTDFDPLTGCPFASAIALG